MTLNHRCFAFYGRISNRDNVIEMLGLEQEVSTKALLYAAFKTWKLDFNQQVLGDYALVLPLTIGSSASPDSTLSAPTESGRIDECFISCSAFSSFSLFYQATDMAFSLSTQLNDYMTDALLDPVAIGQLFTLQYIVPPLTLVKGVRQMVNGESQIWQFVPQAQGFKVTCLAHKTLTLMEKLNTSRRISTFDEPQSIEGTYLDAKGLQDESPLDPALVQLQSTEFDAFMALPILSRLLSEPVTHMRQVALFEALLNQEGDTYVSQSGFTTLGFKAQGHSDALGDSTAQRNQGWDKAAQVDNKRVKSLYKRIFKSTLGCAFKAQRQTQLRLRQEYQTQMLSFQALGQVGAASAQSALPSFDTWLDLSVRLPIVWRQERLMAQSLGKKIHFACLDANVIRHSLVSSKQVNAASGLAFEAFQSSKEASYFSLEDDSLLNLFDAMQRLMMHGYKPVTNRLFKIVPPLTAKLINQQKQRQKVETFCMQSLTLDHLSRHQNCSLAAT